MCPKVHVSPVSKLRDPLHASFLAGVHKPTAPTANLMLQRAMSRVIEFSKQGSEIIHDGAETRLSCGRKIKGPKQVLDIARMERFGEASLYDTKGQRVFLIRDFKDEALEQPKGLTLPLIRMDDAWRMNSRRTINRHYEKIEHPSQRAVDRRLLSMQFWLDASAQILNLNAGA